MRLFHLSALLALSAAPALAQMPDAAVLASQSAPPGVVVPDWALPDSPTHHQVAPPLDFHRDTITYNKTVGRFENQSDVGAALVPGDSSYDPVTQTYTITSAGYNIWYQRDEFRYLWVKVSGDVSMAATITWPDPTGFGDRKAGLIIRQSLKDDSVEALVALHGAGMVHLARREVENTRIKDMEYRVGSRGGLPGGKTPDSLVPLIASRIGIEKHGDQYRLYVGWQGEPMHVEGAPVTVQINGPFYVGIGLASHMAATVTTAKVSDLVLENRAGQVH